MSPHDMAEHESTPVSRRKLSDQVVDQLLAQVEAGRLVPGTQLPSERQLMEQYQVGRPAVREALQSLERMGLIAISHGERARVAEFNERTLFGQIGRSARYLLSTSPQTLEHLKEARLGFEIGMVRVAVARATEVELAELKRILEEHKTVNDDPPRFLELDMAFHKKIAALTHNPIHAAVSEAMLDWLGEYHAGLVRAPGAESVTLSEHDTIYECIAARDADGAARAMSDHITRASSLYRQHEPVKDGGG